MNIKYKIFNKNLKRERKNKGLTQQSIADILDVSQKRYAKWEEDVWPPRQYKDLVKLPKKYYFCQILV